MTYISVLTEAHAVRSKFIFFPASFALLKAGVLLSGEHLVVADLAVVGLSQRICSPVL